MMQIRLQTCISTITLSKQIVAIVSITFIIISTVVLTLNTLPYFSNRDSGDHEKDYPPFALLEAIYMSWFTFEFVVSYDGRKQSTKICKEMTTGLIFT